MADDEILSMEEFEDAVPQTAYFRVYRCPSCSNAHVVLFNHLDEPFAQIVLGSNNLKHLVSGCEQVYTMMADVIPFHRS